MAVTTTVKVTVAPVIAVWFAGWVVIASLFYAPLTEEPAKWLAATVPAAVL